MTFDEAKPFNQAGVAGILIENVNPGEIHRQDLGRADRNFCEDNNFGHRRQEAQHRFFLMIRSHFSRILNAPALSRQYLPGSKTKGHRGSGAWSGDQPAVPSVRSGRFTASGRSGICLTPSCSNCSSQGAGTTPRMRSRLWCNRHGPMVLGVCRRMLRGSHDWEDAFQATFLVLARRAASIGRREQLASWLYGVAVRTAKEARRRAARQYAGERRMMDVPQVESEPAAENRDDLLAFLDEELNRLPSRFRSALVACELEGKSRREAAQQLGIPEGTLSTHLARGRKLLRERLQRRGVSLGVGPVAGLPPPIAEAAIPERLMGATVRAALGYASGCGTAATVPAAVASLAERVLKMMFLTRLTLVIAALMTAAGAVARGCAGFDGDGCRTPQSRSAQARCG